MKRISSCYRYCLVVVFVAGFFIPSLRAQTGEQYITQMHAKYKDNWYRTLRFTQDTEIYKNDSLVKKSTWYEVARFPFELRIDVDAVDGGNTTIYKKDSTYRIRNHKLQSVTTDPNPFVFFLGGMYMLPLDTVKLMLTRNGYNLQAAAVTNWQGKKTFIIGAGNDKDTSHNQFWVDAEHLYIVRVILKSGPALLDVQLSGHVKLPKGWSEKMVQFYRNGSLLQVEKYRDIEPDAVIGAEVFDVSRFR